MSLMMTALRIAAVEAIKGKTEFGDKVMDSAIGAISETDGAIGTSQTAPFIAVYTDAAESGASIGPLFLYEGGNVELSFELGIAEHMFVSNDDGEKVFDVGIPVTDATTELQLDLVVRQLKDALLASNDNPWGELFRRINTGISKIKAIRAGRSEGIKLAARQVTITMSILDDPMIAENSAQYEVFETFLDLLTSSGDPAYVAHAQRCRDLLNGEPLGIPEAISHGLSSAVAEVVGLNQIDPDAEPLSQISIEDADGTIQVELADA